MVGDANFASLSPHNQALGQGGVLTKSKISTTQARVGISIFILIILWVLIASFISIQSARMMADPLLKIFTSKIFLAGVLGDFVWLWLNPKFLLQSGNLFKVSEPKLELSYRPLHYISNVLILVGLLDVFTSWP